MNARYLIGRLLQGVIVILGASLIVFTISRLTGDPAVLMAGPGATEAELDQFRERLGLDQPIIVQYGHYLAGIMRGDFGDSIWQNQPALPLILERMPYTLLLTVCAVGFALVVAFPVGIFAALARGTWWDQAIMVLALIGQAMPVFWLGLILILVFAERLGWLPSSGTGSWKHLVLPTITLGAFSMARTARLVRSGMLEVLGADYVRTARAKGLNQATIVLRHALKNALIPVLTVLGLEFGALLGGAVLTETIFAWPGIGRLVYQAILQRDFPLVQAVVFVFAIVFVLGNLIVDLLYLYLDPRIRYVL